MHDPYAPCMLISERIARCQVPEIKEILCPVDFSELSRHALDHALAIVAWYEARLTVFHVFSTPQPVVLAPVMAESVPPIPLRQPHEVAEEVRETWSRPSRSS